MAEQELDRNQAATPYKLQKARERGQVARSTDLVSAVVFTASMVFLSWHGWATWRDEFRLDRAVLIEAAHVGSPAGLWSLIERALLACLALAGPFLATILLAAVAANVLQSGPVLSVDPIKPDWSRLNPATGFRRVFSLRTLFHGARAVLKLALLGATVYFALKSLVPHLFALAELDALTAIGTLLDDLASLGFKIALMLGGIAVLDLIFTRREFARQMRMSHRELKEEIRHREGDPRIRARLRELRREMLKRARSLRRTRDADVLITNPTHVAVALRYVHGEMESPQLVAKGAGMLAAAMRAVATRHGIPIVQNPTLARALFHDLTVDRAVPPDLYAAVARIIVWVFAMRDARNGGARRTVPRDASANLGGASA
jgi:flagellar biosynthesis protein FlhB